MSLHFVRACVTPTAQQHMRVLRTHTGQQHYCNHFHIHGYVACASAALYKFTTSYGFIHRCGPSVGLSVCKCCMSSAVGVDKRLAPNSITLSHGTNVVVVRSLAFRSLIRMLYVVVQHSAVCEYTCYCVLHAINCKKHRQQSVFVMTLFQPCAACLCVA